MKVKTYIWYMIWCILVTSTGCTKSEFVPTEEGAPIPAEEVRPTIEEYLEANGKMLFKRMWERSNLNDSLTSWGQNVSVSVFIPSDQAISEAGYTNEKITALSATELDSMLLYHVVSAQLDSRVMLPKNGNAKTETKLGRPLMRMLGSESSFLYEHYVGLKADGIYVNGKHAGTFNSEPFSHGMLVPIDRFLERPRRTMLETLENDPRFSIYAEVLKSNDDGYRVAGRKTIPWMSFDGVSFATGLPRVRSIAIVAPTNEAFINAGLPDAESVARMNERSSFNALRGIQASDSILTYHQWGRHYYGTNNFANNMNPLVFFSNDLSDQNLGNYVIGRAVTGTSAWHMPFEFFKENGKIRMRLKGNTGEPVALIETDIMSLNGPIHVVDRLFIPDGFSLEY